MVGKLIDKKCLTYTLSPKKHEGYAFKGIWKVNGILIVFFKLMPY